MSTLRRALVELSLSLLCQLIATADQASPSSSEIPAALAYLLGPEDEITVDVFEMAEIQGKSIRLDTSGVISLPAIGRVQAGGLTVQGLEQALRDRLKDHLLDPRVTVTITDHRSHSVSVIGAVNKPGLVHLRGKNSLVQVLSMAGGLSNDAGEYVRITRRAERGSVPLANAVADASGRFIWQMSR